AVSGHTGEPDVRSQPRRRPDPIWGAKVRFDFFPDRNQEPNANGKSCQSPARQQLEVITVRFLRSEGSGSIMILRHRFPVRPHANAQYRMGGNYFKREAPDLVSAYA